MRRVIAASAIAGVALLLAPSVVRPHPMGNFSISHHAAIEVRPGAVELRYRLDLAEIPAFQELQDSGLVAEAGHPRLGPYLARKAGDLARGLLVTVDGQPLTLEVGPSALRFTPGAGDLPTMKLDVVYRAPLDGAGGPRRLVYRDRNYAERVGWKEVVVRAGAGVAIAESSAPERDRSRGLTDYPADLLDTPPQVVEAVVTFTAASRLQETPPAVSAAVEPDRQVSPPDPFTRLVAVPRASAGVMLFAAMVAVALGAVHALEPGHGKTVVAAYLVGSRGTARHALLLGLIVTASHTAGVYLLGAVTLYASRYIVPDRLYPWLGLISGTIIATLGILLFARRYAGRKGHHHADGHEHRAGGPHGGGPHNHDHAHGGHHHHHHHHHHHGHRHQHHHLGPGNVSARELLALGITGGIVPCPAALVVLLSAVALRRIGFGLLLIAAFSIGLAAVLVAIGLLIVHARRLMVRFRGDGPLIARWLPLTSSAAITILGVTIAVRALGAIG